MAEAGVDISTGKKSRSLSENQACLLFGLLLLVTLWPSLSSLLPGLADEGTVAVNASRLLYGELPYRDYFLRLPPLTDWTIGVWLGLLGSSLASLRSYFVVSALISTVAVTKLSYRHLSARLFWLAPLWFILVGPQAWPMASFAWDATTWALLAILLLDTASSRRAYLATGFLVAACGMALHTKGAALWLGAVIALLSTPRADRGRAYAWVNLGVAIPSLIFLLFLASYGSVGLFFHQTLAFNAGAYLQAQGHSLDLSPVAADFAALRHGFGLLLQQPGLVMAAWFAKAASYFVVIDLVGLALYYPLVVVGGLFLIWRGNLTRSMKALVWTLLLASLLDLGRPNRYHLNFHLPLFALLLVLLVDRLPLLAKRGAVPFLAACVLLVGWSNLESWRPYRHYVSLPRGEIYTQDAAEAEFLRELYQLTSGSGREEFMFAFPDASLSAWLVGKRNPTALTAALPLFYTEEMFAEAKRRIEATKTEWLLYRPVSQASVDEYKFDGDDFARRQEALRAFLTQGYEPVRDWGGTILYRRSSRAGLPASTPADSTSRTSTAPAPSSVPAAIAIPSRITEPAPK